MQIKKTIIALSVSAFLVSACASNPSNTQKGVAIGAVVGALLGKATGDNKKSRYVWGAAVGAIAGGAIGAYMDKHEKALRDALAEQNIEIDRRGDELYLIMPGDNTFMTGSANLASSFTPILQSVSKVLNQYEKTTIVVEGHTDDVGAEDYNQQLSEQRANAVKSILLSSKVDARRLTTVGFGEYQPLVPNSNAASRQQNRRVEIKIQPVTES
jgi:outer membrane protein OmpA-like peptidoglycan-associated protein